MLQFFFSFLNLCLNINEVSDGNCKLLNTDHKGTCIAGLLLDDVNCLEVCNLLNYTVERLKNILLYGIEFQFYLRCDILLVTYGAYTATTSLMFSNVLTSFLSSSDGSEI